MRMEKLINDSNTHEKKERERSNTKTSKKEERKREKKSMHVIIPRVGLEEVCAFGNRFY